MNATKTGVGTRPSRYGLLGYPLGHSLSPQIHQRLMALAGLAGTYELLAIPPEEIAGRMSGFLEAFDGLNVTIPHKQVVKASLDQVDPLAEMIGAVNTITCPSEGPVSGYNTDLEGFLSDAPELSGRRVLILGAGGVCRTLAFAAGLKGAIQIRFLVRHPEKALPLAKAIAAAYPACAVDVTSEASSCYTEDQTTPWQKRWVVLNGTPAGMWPHTGNVPIPDELFDHVQAVYDTIYNPFATRLVLRAQSRGIPARGGLGMLVNQALLAQQIWNPAAIFPADTKEQVLKGLAGEIYRQSPVTLVLMGFMGSGKSRVGRELAFRTSWPLVDLDHWIEEKAGRTIPEIFNTGGEAAFRKLEEQALDEVLSNHRCQILATGGGALMSAAAQAILYSHPALVIYLSASLETIEARVGDGTGRPMIAGQDRARLALLYDKRRPIYSRLADLVVNADLPLEEKLDTIMTTLGLGGVNE
ncbi:MAG: shikimate kinase [Eubacteriales bacterium]|nr:shikimate kinase [Eubacteriales bacterium]